MQISNWNYSSTEYFFVARNRFVKNVTEQPQKLHIAGEYHTRFQSPNVQQVESLTE